MNTKDVTWTYNSDGWTLAISESGSYKLTESFNMKFMTVSALNVVIGGNGKNITAVAGSGNSVITVSGENGELKNLMVTSSAEFANVWKIIELSGKGSKLTNSEIDASSSKISTSSGRASFHTAIVSGEGAHVSGSTIKAGTGKDSSSQCIVVQGKDIRITDNILTPNTVSKYKGDSSEEVMSGRQYLGENGTECRMYNNHHRQHLHIYSN